MGHLVLFRDGYRHFSAPSTVPFYEMPKNLKIHGNPSDIRTIKEVHQHEEWEMEFISVGKLFRAFVSMKFLEKQTNRIPGIRSITNLQIRGNNTATQWVIKIYALHLLHQLQSWKYILQACNRVHYQHDRKRGSEREKSTNARSLFNIVGIYKLENELTHTRLVNSRILITNPHY